MASPARQFQPRNDVEVIYSDDEDNRLESTVGSRSSGSDSDDGFVASIVNEIQENVMASGVKRLQRSYFIGTLALWHSYGFWLAACIDICVALVLLIRWYVGWLRFAMSECGTDTSAFGAACMAHFFTTFLRAFLLLAVVGELARFCYWLYRDCWREDAFEAYRRTLLGEARAEMELGQLYSVGWPSRVVNGWARYADLVVQIVIYSSLDVFPLLKAWQASSLEGSTPGTVCVALFGTLAMVSVCHVLAFWLAWTFTDVYVKVECFMLAQEGVKDFTLDAKEVLRETMLEELREARENGDEEGYLLLESALEFHAGEREKLSPKAANGSTSRKRTIADRLSLCAPLRGLAHFFAPHCCWLLCIVIGAAMESLPLIVCGTLLAPLLLTYTYMKLHHSHKTMRSLPLFCDSPSESVWALQAWGEVCCGLAIGEQLKRRVAFAKIVIIQTIMFAALGWWSYVGSCLLLLLATSIKQVTLYMERPWSWVVGIVEGVVVALITAWLGFVYPTTEKWATGAPSLGLLAISVMRQFGLARENGDCYRLMHAVQFVLSLALLIIVGVVLFSEMTYNSAANYTMGSSFCRPGAPNCRYYEVPYRPPNETHSLTCPAWFSMGVQEDRFPLSDFGLFSWLAYEPIGVMDKALNHYFPGWRVVHAHWASVNDQTDTADWSTFFEFASPSNKTSVFAIRGTHTAVDALNDIVLWTPAVVMQGFSMSGPSVMPAMAVALGAIVSFFEGYHEYDIFFERCLEYVQKRIAEEPHREFFVTGHSLGGGLAKLVAAKANLRAVTFMAPGLSTTSHVVYRDFDGGDILKGSEILTVQPSYDIVSRLDMQTGLVVPLGCAQTSGLYCHLIGPALCEIYKACGSGRQGRTVTLPCGTCEDMPCPSADGTPVNATWPYPIVAPANQSQERKLELGHVGYGWDKLQLRK